MVVILKERTTSARSGSAVRGSSQPGAGESDVVTREFEVPSKTVTGFIAKLGGFTAVVTTLTTFLTFWFTDVPKRRDQGRNTQLEILQRALQVEDDSQRLASVRLLLRMGLLEDERELARFIDSLETLPYWEPTSASGLASESDAAAEPSQAQKKATAADSVAKDADRPEPPPLPRRR